MNPIFIVIIYISCITSVHYITSLRWTEYRNFISMILIMIIMAATWASYDQDKKLDLKIATMVDEKLKLMLEEKEHLATMKSLPLALPGDEIWSKS